MKQLLEGSLSETLTLKDLLVGILQAEAPGVSVLQLSIDNKNQYGEMFFLGGHFVVGANLNETDIAAEEALNHLLQLKEASFRYYACDSLEALPANKPLKIDLKEILDNWNIKLPLSSNELLDKIFNEVESPSEIKTAPPVPEAKVEKVAPSANVNKEPVVSPFRDKQSDVDWDLVNPLLIGGAPGDKAISSIGSDWEDNAYSTQELRSVTRGKEWQRKLRNLILIFIMLLIVLMVILCFAWLMMNSPSSEVSPRRYLMNLTRHGFRRPQNFNHAAPH